MSAPYDIGDLVYATEDLFNDGFIPDMPAEGLLAAAGSRHGKNSIFFGTETGGTRLIAKQVAKKLGDEAAPPRWATGRWRAILSRRPQP